MVQGPIWADDLTGASDCASVLGALGLKASLVLEGTRVDASEYACVNLNTRACLTSKEAYSLLYNAMSSRKSTLPLPYFKIDSTWRGHIVATALAGLEASQAPFALICPAFPQMGRTVQGAVAYLQGKPLHETPLGQDPQHPIYTSDLRRLLQWQAEALGRAVEIWIPSLTEGEEGLAERLQEELEKVEKGERKSPLLVVPDLQKEEDFTVWLNLVDSLPMAPVCLGSAGWLSAQLQAKTRVHALPPVFSASFWAQAKTDVPKIRVISGSLNPTTLAQLAHLQKSFPRLPILNTATWGRVSEASTRLAQGLPSFLKDHPALVTILCGGDTAQQVLTSLGLSHLTWVSRFKQGQALWQAEDAWGETSYWILKSGNMGEAPDLTEWIHALSLPLAEYL
ncbi:MAG: four-carbon acid sugar kinase family protein [Vampirovibrio sp.]